MRTSDLDDLAPVIGYRATRILQACFPARRLHVPTRTWPTHPLARLIGAPALEAMVREYPGERFWIPSQADDDAFRRDWQIAERMAAGQGVADIAHRFGLTAKRVQAIRVELVDRGWLDYAQGFRTAMQRAPKAAQHGKPDDPPRFLGTSEVFGEPPG